jgi:hypothetical protein
MSYYPLLKSPNCTGWVQLSNFAPNDWELSAGSKVFINVTWAFRGNWHSETLDYIGSEKFFKVNAIDVKAIVPDSALPLISMSEQVLPKVSKTLPVMNRRITKVPAWRANIGLESKHSSTSFQGELEPFVPTASLLSFSPLLQFGKNIENYLIFLNLEHSPLKRTAELVVLDAKKMARSVSVTISNNNANVINLNIFEFNPSDIPLISCSGMSGIPLYFSTTMDGRFLSLEHSHPPASLVIHGSRSDAQRLIKGRWLSKEQEC